MRQLFTLHLVIIYFNPFALSLSKGDVHELASVTFMVRQAWPEPAEGLTTNGMWFGLFS